MVFSYNQFLKENNSTSLVELFKDIDEEFYNKITQNTFIISADNLMNSTEVKKNMLRDQGSAADVDSWVDYYFAKERNFKNNIYYHLDTNNETPYSGLGNGLYIGRDPIALIHFYDIEENGFTVSEYKGIPKWLELTDDNDYSKFRSIIKEIGHDIVNSDVVGTIVTQMGFDGIRYYDYNATGEEFVLFNMDKLKKNKTHEQSEII
jgi:hypothetical protein